MINDRDQRAIDFVNMFGAATTSQLSQIYFRGEDKEPPKKYMTVLRRRLKNLTDDKVLKRKRFHLNMEYIYYNRWSSQVQHKITVADVYLKFLQMPGELVQFSTERQLDGLRPDAVIEFKRDKKTYWFFLEVQLSNSFNQQKYEDYYNGRKYTSVFAINGISTFPKVIVVSPRKLFLQPSRINYVMLPLDLEGIERIFE